MAAMAAMAAMFRRVVRKPRLIDVVMIAVVDADALMQAVRGLFAGDRDCREGRRFSSRERRT
ncbi:hypothetical protein [Stenotrophomonas sp. UBA7606]|jgi:hypothetical protein|uniref:hypothetical protein n=1 Tax=Stenotrophomonas sp. UBA7606 TaxID=1947559 RepID=UPI0025F0B411|nr:hypothetical protein [Stenotrophomonas sp. UBA7606]